MRSSMFFWLCMSHEIVEENLFLRNYFGYEKTGVEEGSRSLSYQPKEKINPV